MSYVDAIHNREKDIVQVVERVNGKRARNSAKYIILLQRCTWKIY